jgi:hypothetical protein
MPYTTVYLQYIESRGSSDSSDDRDDEDEELNDLDDFGYDEDNRALVEFSPVKLSAKEPRGDSMELELDFEADAGDTLHLVVVRYNNPRTGALEDWCVEKVMMNGDEAEDLVEKLEDGLAPSECQGDSDEESVIVKAEVFSMTLHAR